MYGRRRNMDGAQGFVPGFPAIRQKIKAGFVEAEDPATLPSV